MIINLLLTGDELMTGDIVDSNSAMIARLLLPLGWTLRRKLTVGDELPLLVESLQTLARDCDVLLVNGGLGPTVDDLTAEALATACGVPLAEHPAALAHLQSWCGRIGLRLDAANRKQALLPAGAAIIANVIGSAVGFQMRLGRCLIICTPGVPRELEPMLRTEILPQLRAEFGAGGAAVRKLALFGIGESTLQQRISDAIPDWPAAVGLGFRAGFPQLDLKLTVQNAAALPDIDQLLPRLQPLIGDFLLGEGDITLPEYLVQLLDRRGHRLTAAESCTGGQIAALITQVPGASKVFDAGFVTYSNTIKERVLGVSAAALAEVGAVSETVALQMAAGALRNSGADYAIAVSGIAGPDGGSADKPVGTVWIAWGTAAHLRAQRLLVRLPRQQFQQYVSYIGLDLIRRELLGIDTAPSYFRGAKNP
jgi:nicotinamide-nucleotide amidase